MSQRLCFKIPRETNTYADVLMALGTASLLNEIYGDEARTTIEDRGDNLSIEVSSDKGLEFLDTFTRLDIGYPFVKQKNDEIIPNGVDDVLIMKRIKKLKRHIINSLRHLEKGKIKSAIK